MTKTYPRNQSEQTSRLLYIDQRTSALSDMLFGGGIIIIGFRLNKT